MNRTLPGENGLGWGETSRIDELDQLARPRIYQCSRLGHAASVTRVHEGDPIGLFGPMREPDRDEPRAGGSRECYGYRAIGINALRPLASHNRRGAVGIAAWQQRLDGGTYRLGKCEIHAAEAFGDEHDKGPDAKRVVQVAVQAQPPRTARNEKGGPPAAP